MSRLARALLVTGLLLTALVGCGANRGRDDEDTPSKPDASTVQTDGGGCASPLTHCEDSCVNLEMDRSHCGRCGHTCDDTEICTNRKCALSPCAQTCGTGSYCDSELKECRPGCDASFQCPQPGNCDVETHTCTCSTGTHLCGDACVSNDSPQSCGDACSPCPIPPNGSATCDGETCGTACDSGFHFCGNTCVSSFSTSTCGSSCTPCQAPLGSTATCDGNVCGVQCDSGTHQCGNACTSNASTATCGNSCLPCPTPVNGTATCDGAQCGVACNTGYALCNGQCVAESVNQCGSNCQACTSAPANGTPDCIDGACSFRCAPPSVKVGSTCATAIAVSAQKEDTCVLTGSGGVRCFNNKSVGLNADVSAISSGWYHSCAIVKGAVKCWGDNTYGQLGDGTNTASNAAVSVTFPSGVSIAQVSAGWYHTCAVSTANQLFCWGLNQYGLFGIGSSTDSNAPVLSLSSGAAEVACGKSFTCVRLTGGTVQCAGNNYWGQLGQATSNNMNSSVFVTVKYLSGATLLRAGKDHVCAMTTSNGLMCWGSNSRNETYQGGQCSTRASEDYCSRAYSSSYQNNIADISLGYWLTCALTKDGYVGCTGLNNDGQTGGGTSSDRAAATPVSANAVAVGAANAGFHVCAVISGGGIKCWGDNTYGQLGDGTTTDRYSPVDATVP